MICFCLLLPRQDNPNWPNNSFVRFQQSTMDTVISWSRWKKNLFRKWDLRSHKMSFYCWGKKWRKRETNKTIWLTNCTVRWDETRIKGHCLIYFLFFSRLPFVAMFCMEKFIWCVLLSQPYHIESNKITILPSCHLQLWL